MIRITILRRGSALSATRLSLHTRLQLNLPHEVPDGFYLVAIGGSGLFKEPLSQEMIMHLALEVITQLEEERDSRMSNDKSTIIASVAADLLVHISRAGWQPLIDTQAHHRSAAPDHRAGPT